VKFEKNRGTQTTGIISVGNQADSRGPVLFNAVLTPNQPLPSQTLRLFMAILGGIFFAGSCTFIWLGAWPISGFFCLEFLVFCLATRACCRRSRLVETVSLCRDLLTVERINPAGTKTTWHFQPYWLQISLKQKVGRPGELTLSARGKSIRLGSFLSANEQTSLAHALETALRRA
jgi:uncharacterized membrane protein